MRAVWAGLILLGLLAPGAVAGSAARPEIEDPVDVADSAADITSVWFDAREEGLRFSIRTVDGSMPVQFPDHVYWIYFVVDGTEVGAAVGFGQDGLLRGHLTTGPDGGLNDARIWRGGFERVANGGALPAGEDRGRPSTWTGLIPWGAVDGLEPGARLTDLVAGSARFDRAGGRWEGGIDRATTDADYVAHVAGPLARLTAGVLPILVPAWVIPVILVACTATGLAGGFALARVRRPAPSAPVATSVPVRTVAPPGERFRHAPGAKR